MGSKAFSVEKVSIPCIQSESIAINRNDVQNLGELTLNIGAASEQMNRPRSKCGCRQRCCAVSTRHAVTQEILWRYDIRQLFGHACVLGYNNDVIRKLRQLRCLIQYFW